MKGRFGFFVGFGAGYVLGSKAGRERYEQIRRLYENVTSSPGFQRASGKARVAVGTGLESAKDVATTGASKVTGAIKERGSSDDRASSLTVAPPPG